MSRYVGQHFAEPETPPVRQATISNPRPNRLKTVGVVAGALIALAGSFFAGRITAPDSNGSTQTKTTAPTTTAPLTAADQLVNQALALHQAGKIDEAAALYNQALTVDSKNKFALYNLGQIAQSRKQFDEAIAKYNAALAVDPKYGPALYNIGLAYAAKGDRAKAIEMLRRALDLTPNSAPVLFNLGTLLVQDGKSDEGARMIAQALAIDPTLKPAS